MSSMVGELVTSDGKNFYSKNESFMKFTKNGDSWIARDKSGKKYIFGKVIKIKGTNHTKMWALTEVQGVYENNKYVINYTPDSESLGKPYIESIVYNDNGSGDETRVTFHYGSFSGFQETESYRLGGYESLEKRLDRITIANKGTTVDTYTFHYTNDRLQKVTIQWC